MQPAVFLDRDNTLIDNGGDLGELRVARLEAQVGLLPGIAARHGPWREHLGVGNGAPHREARDEVQRALEHQAGGKGIEADLLLPVVDVQPQVLERVVPLLAAQVVVRQ